MKRFEKWILPLVLCLCLVMTGAVGATAAKYIWSRAVQITLSATYTEKTEPKVIGEFHMMASKTVFDNGKSKYATFPIMDLGNGVYQVQIVLPNSSSDVKYENYIEFNNPSTYVPKLDSDKYLQLDETKENGNPGGSVDQGGDYKGFMKSRGGTYTIRFEFFYNSSKQEYDGSWWTVSEVAYAAEPAMDYLRSTAFCLLPTRIA